MDKYISINSSTDDITTSNSISNQIIFYIFLFLDIPSILCSIILFYYFIRLPELRLHPQFNEILIYLLIGSFLVTAIDIPLILPYLQNSYYILLMKYPHLFCIFWIIYDYGMYSLNLWLITLTCFERYLLIFFKQFIQKTRRRRFFIYYGLVTIIVLFIIFWYIYLVGLYPCVKSQFDFTQMLCGLPCYQFTASAVVLTIDLVIPALFPVFLTIFLIFLLIFHILYQKQKIRRHLIQQQTWQRTRKMFLHLLPITLIFLIFNMPLIIVGMLATSDTSFYKTLYFYVNYISYCQSLFMPFAVLSRQNIIRKRLLNLFRYRQMNRTAPMTISGH